MYKPMPAAQGLQQGSRRPAEPNHFLSLGNALQAQGKWDEAIASYRNALALAPEHVDAHNNLGALFQRQGKLDAAVASYGKALSFKPDAADLHYNLASALRDLGTLSEAIVSYRKAIAIDPGHVLAHSNLGNALGAEGDLDGAVASYRQALAFNPDSVEAHYNLGVTLQLQGQLDAAVTCYQHALARKPDHVVAQYNMGKAFTDQGNLDAAVSSFRNVLALRPDIGDVRNSLGNVLQAQGKLEEAIDCYRTALALNPTDAGAYNNLGNALNEVGRIDAAVSSYRRALELKETPEFRANFALCIRRMDAAGSEIDPRLRRLVTRAIVEPWARPSDLAKASISVICADPVIGDCVGRASRAWPARLGGQALYGPTGLATFSTDLLLQHLLKSAQVCDLALERFLTMARHAMLETANAAATGDGLDDKVLQFYCAIARQCFINEFIFSCTEDESSRAALLREKLVATLQSGHPVPALWVVTAASYAPLLSPPSAESLLHRSWPESVMALLDQHIAEPLAEQRCRDRIRKLTIVDDAVSTRVQHQYEENPYPRWVKLPPAATARSVNAYLRQQLPFAPFHPLGNDDDVEILIAGCGTGQEAIETAQQFPAARVLAVDLSLSSLGYAKRKTDAQGVTNIDYAQGDILKLGSIGRTFDMIASVGVLHHLANPAAGLQVLVSLLRPGGLMRLGLYSQRARGDVVAARAFIAARGYASDAIDIRRCRQDLIENFGRFERLTSRRDFFVTSECRDLLFHVQEHRFTLPQIKDLLGTFGLHFMGFLLEPSVIQEYRVRFPGDNAKTNLDHWNDFENVFPDTFAGMYRFWVQKPPV